MMELERYIELTEKEITAETSQPVDEYRIYSSQGTGHKTKTICMMDRSMSNTRTAQYRSETRRNSNEGKKQNGCANCQIVHNECFSETVASGRNISPGDVRVCTVQAGKKTVRSRI